MTKPRRTGAKSNQGKKKTVVKRNGPPGKTIEAREQQLIHQAMNETERRIQNGTATSQMLVHFLKQGSISERLNQEQTRNQNLLLLAKVEALENQQKQIELYEEALRAMKRYSGQTDLDDDN